jgi:hypothetical protein
VNLIEEQRQKEIMVSEMKTPTYIKNLTPVERAAAIKLGACVALARNNMTPEDWQKRAGGLGDFANGAMGLSKGLIVSALLAGVPIGMLAHGVGRAISPDDRREREALDRLRFYRRMTAGMTTGLTPNKNEGTPNGSTPTG